MRDTPSHFSQLAFTAASSPGNHKISQPPRQKEGLDFLDHIAESPKFLRNSFSPIRWEAGNAKPPRMADFPAQNWAGDHFSHWESKGSTL